MILGVVDKIESRMGYKLGVKIEEGRVIIEGGGS